MNDETEKEIVFTINDNVVDVEYSDNLKVEDMILVFAHIVLDLRHNGVSDNLLNKIIDKSILTEEDENES